MTNPAGKTCTRCLLPTLAAIALLGCATPSSQRAPVEERGIELKKATAPMSAPAALAPAKKTPVATHTYIVQKGDTMYSIAFLHGIDYRELAELNNIQNPSAIQIGQQLTIPVSGTPKIAEKKIPSPQAVVPGPAGAIKSQPKAGKIPYSDKALAQAEKMQEDGNPAVTPVKAEAPASKDAEDEEDLEWGMPSSGKVIAEFSESANRKGVDIAGKQGQPVVASAAGKVVYSGSGLRGYGKLVIIKHNKTFLSAYAHNDQILVKEGQSVSKGQKIAEMGSTDTDQVKLHFEIRKLGKPVDPAQYLPLIKS